MTVVKQKKQNAKDPDVFFFFLAGGSLRCQTRPDAGTVCAVHFGSKQSQQTLSGSYSA